MVNKEGKGRYETLSYSPSPFGLWFIVSGLRPMIKRLALRKAVLLVLLIIIASGITFSAIYWTWPWQWIVGSSIIGLLLFFNVSRRVYPAREILRQIAEEERAGHDEADQSP